MSPHRSRLRSDGGCIELPDCVKGSLSRPLLRVLDVLDLRAYAPLVPGGEGEAMQMGVSVTLRADAPPELLEMTQGYEGMKVTDRGVTYEFSGRSVIVPWHLIQYVELKDAEV